MKNRKVVSRRSAKVKFTLLRQMLSYGVIGLISSGTDALLFALFVYVFHWFSLAANLVSVSVGITISFFLNRKYTFKISDHIKRRYIVFFGVGMIGLCISEIILWGGHVLAVNAMVTKLCSIVLVSIVQFVLNKLISFKPDI